MNKWIGTGKVIKDPTIRYKEDKASFVAFTMMCKRNRKIKDGDQAVDFIDCICTGNIAELARQYLRDGKKIEVMGRYSPEAISTAKPERRFIQRQYSSKN